MDFFKGFFLPKVQKLSILNSHRGGPNGQNICHFLLLPSNLLYLI